jgi:hypothetical protein
LFPFQFAQESESWGKKERKTTTSTTTTTSKRLIAKHNNCECRAHTALLHAQNFFLKILKIILELKKL